MRVCIVQEIACFFVVPPSVEIRQRRNLIACLFERQLCHHPPARIQHFTQQEAVLYKIRTEIETTSRSQKSLLTPLSKTVHQCCSKTFKPPPSHPSEHRNYDYALSAMTKVTQQKSPHDDVNQAICQEIDAQKFTLPVYCKAESD